MPLFLVAACFLLLSPAVAARQPIGSLKEKNADNNSEDPRHRRLFGERIGTARESRGGAAGQAKNFQEQTPMRINANAPTPAPMVPTTPVPVVVTLAPVVAVTPPPTPAPITPETLPPTLPPVVTGCNIGGVAYPEGSRLPSVRLTDCYYGNPADYECYCDSRKPDQYVCPYCEFVDVFGLTICATDTQMISFVAKFNVPTSCTCNVGIVPNGPFFDATVTTDCVDL